ncbi:glycosyltransferase family 2 protein [Rhodopseudomonas palustris]|uniref:Glycosyltransferase family 2 protein n=1 Tax=Rhodopseudomonas palustris TaxID=1076 RepID=A0AAX3DWJ0_RHOPL|nr:glycosyltransferase family A protein [Rhodopseudomonas palustris]UYO38357.1 glycosyltransferase family 2 protein [Rhodopseudomonas palustris]
MSFDTSPKTNSESPVDGSTRSTRIAVVVASTGRPEELGRWKDHILRQTLQPSRFVFAVVKPSDLPPSDSMLAGAEVVYCNPGLPVQRNAALELLLGSTDIIAFFDDDYVPSAYCLEGIEDFFQHHPAVVAVNGSLLADGINTAGIPYEEAIALVDANDRNGRPKAKVICSLDGLYGCNMVYRSAAIGAERFDENLPLYAWQEDIDFAARVGRQGGLALTTAFAGVHQGVKAARLAGVRLGYSQIVNPMYLMRKGTLSVKAGIRLIARNLVMNHVRAFKPEPWIDRRGRCKGNWIGILDLVIGRDHPKNILSIRQ